MSQFEVDKAGLAKIARRRGLSFIISELWQNCVDTNAKNISISLLRIPGRRQAEIIVSDDDPNGFANLASSYTLFAESEKIRDPEKRGRFNLGEKLVIAVCEEAQISSTTGTVCFDSEGRRHSNRKRPAGSEFRGTIKMTREEYDECCNALWMLIPPEGVSTTVKTDDISGELIHRRPLHVFETTLPTEIADEEGILRPTRRKTLVKVYESKETETAHLYELGIPVVEVDGEWHIEVFQKVPLNTERDNVTPSYLRQVRVAVLNEMHPKLTKDSVTSAWVREAASSPDCSDEAIREVIKLRFDKPVSFDPSDQEANRIAAAEGYSVIYGASMTKGEWENVRRAKVILPAGQVTPSKPTSTVPYVKIPECELTAGMKQVRKFVEEIGWVALKINVAVSFSKTQGVREAATWCNNSLDFNAVNLGIKWFDDGITAQVIDLVIHEFGHYYCGNHLDEKYYKALSKLGGKFTEIALANPKLFR